MRLEHFITPRAFLKIGGALFIAIALAGSIGFLGPTGERSLFGPLWYFDTAENLSHALVGCTMLASTYVLRGHLQRFLAILFGLMALFLALIGLPSGIPEGAELFNARFQNPLDTLFNAFFALWGLASAFKYQARALLARVST